MRIVEIICQTVIMSFDRVKDLDLYKLLNVEKNASESSIRSSYRKLAKSYHPDKNEDPESVFEFHKLVDALNVLTLAEEREKYDKILRKKEEHIRHEKQLDEKSRILKEDLKKREKHLADINSINVESERLIGSLRAEAAKLLNEEQDLLIERLSNLHILKGKSDKPILKVKWAKNCHYSTDSLKTVFDKYGVVENIVQKKRSALIEFQCLESAKIAAKAEQGFQDSPLTLKPLFPVDPSCDTIFVKYDCVKKWPCDLGDALLEIEKYVFRNLL